MMVSPASALLNAARAAWTSLSSDLKDKPDPRAAACPDISAADFARLARLDHYTMTGIERRYALLEAMRYVQRHQIDGAVVECGVWRGGSMMLVAEELQLGGEAKRDLYLYDTFSGMTEPGDEDTDAAGRPARELLAQVKGERSESVLWAMASLEDVRANMTSTGYPQEFVHYIAGRVEETLPGTAPETISLLRLDTDWYESTAHELVHLYPRVSSGGVVIIDDYGCWRGARKAVDEFLARCPDRLHLCRIDETGRLFIKP